MPKVDMLTIKLENVSYSYQQGTPFERTALQNITLDINPGMFLGIAGRSGSGKSTLLQHLNGLLKPTSGRIMVNGIELSGKRLKGLRSQVGVVFQHPEHQLFEETVFKDISFGLSTFGLSSVEIRNRVNETLAAVGLTEDILERSPFELSGGEKKRVAIAGVLVMNPAVLVLDEPAAGLDPRGRREIFDFIGRLQRERGITVVIATHDMDELARLADNVIVLCNGLKLLDGPPRTIFRDSEALSAAGLEPPQITVLMMQLKQLLPEIHDDVVTVDEAVAVLRRLYRRESSRWGGHDTRCADGPVPSRQFNTPQDGSEDEDSAGDHVYGACVSC